MYSDSFRIGYKVFLKNKKILLIIYNKIDKVFSIPREFSISKKDTQQIINCLISKIEPSELICKSNERGIRCPC